MKVTLIDKRGTASWPWEPSTSSLTVKIMPVVPEARRSLNQVQCCHKAHVFISPERHKASQSLRLSNQGPGLEFSGNYYHEWYLLDFRSPLKITHSFQGEWTADWGALRAWYRAVEKPLLIVRKRGGRFPLSQPACTVEITAWSKDSPVAPNYVVTDTHSDDMSENEVKFLVQMVETGKRVYASRFSKHCMRLPMCPDLSAAFCKEWHYCAGDQGPFAMNYHHFFSFCYRLQGDVILWRLCALSEEGTPPSCSIAGNPICGGLCA